MVHGFRHSKYSESEAVVPINVLCLPPQRWNRYVVKKKPNLVCLYKDRTAVFSHRVTFYIRSSRSAFSFKT